MTTQELSAENRALGWAAVPPECPQRFFDKIIERRSCVLAARNVSRMTDAEIRAKVAEIGAQIASDFAEEERRNPVYEWDWREGAYVPAKRRTY